jgi:hypothetical protein
LLQRPLRNIPESAKSANFHDACHKSSATGVAMQQMFALAFSNNGLCIYQGLVALYTAVTF